MRIRQYIVPIIVASTAALLLTNCGPSPLPVDTDVTWEGGREPSGPFEDDPHVQIVREYVLEVGAANNALNYSSERLATLATGGNIHHLVPSRSEVESKNITMAAGPVSFTVTGVDKRTATEVVVEVCRKSSAWWTPHEVDYDKEIVSSVQDGALLRHEVRYYQPAIYILNELGGTWKVRSSGGTSTKECDPGPDVAVGTYTTPPDLSLLTNATPRMVFGPDGKPIG